MGWADPSWSEGISLIQTRHVFCLKFYLIKVCWVYVLSLAGEVEVIHGHSYKQVGKLLYRISRRPVNV